MGRPTPVLRTAVACSTIALRLSGPKTCALAPGDDCPSHPLDGQHHARKRIREVMPSNAGTARSQRAIGRLTIAGATFRGYSLRFAGGSTYDIDLATHENTAVGNSTSGENSAKSARAPPGPSARVQ